MVRLVSAVWKVAPALLLSALGFFLSYILGTNTVIDARNYATQSYLLYAHHIVPQIYPLLSVLSVVPLAVLGVGKPAFLVVPAVAAFLTVVLTYHLSKARYRSRDRAALAAVLAAANPVLVWLSGAHMTETLFTALLALTFLVLVGSKLTARRTFLAGLLSSLAYLARYPGILLFPVIGAWLLLHAKNRRLLAAYFSSLLLVAAYWAANWALFGQPLTTESYSISFIRGGTSLPWQMLIAMGFKVAAGLGLVFGYAAPFLLRRFNRNVRVLLFENPTIFFVVTYAVIHFGYYGILSVSWGFAWSIDHFARYLAPVAPLLLSFARYPSRSRSLNFFLLASLAAAGTAMGLYLANYASLYSQAPVSWSNFLAGLA